MRSETMRTFIALELPAEAKARLAEARAHLQPRLHGVRWVAASGLHLTLRFLGDSTSRQIEQVATALHAATRACPAGTGRLAGLGVFPDRGAPRVLWVGLALPPPFFALQAACERAARDAGFEPERRAFTPHLTLGRWREHAPRPGLVQLDLGHVSGPGAPGAGAPRLTAAPEWQDGGSRALRGPARPRSRSGVNSSAADAQLDLGDAALDRVVLYRSELHPSGAVYTALHAFTLAPAAPA